MAANEGNGGGAPSTPTGPGGGKPTIAKLPTWSEVSDVLGKQFGTVGIAAVAVIFVRKDLESGQTKLSMCVSALNEELRSSLGNAVAPLIGADMAHAERKIILDAGPN